MKYAIVAVLLIITLTLGYIALKFVEAKGVCERKVLESQTTFYMKPGDAAKRNAALNEALASPECVRVQTFAKFFQHFFRGD
jgi:hypothetical protein